MAKGIPQVRPMVEWSALYEESTLDENQTMERTAAELAVTYARLSAYLSRRMAGGKHADAVKAQNKAARGTRQALGYTYKDDAISF